MTDERGMKTSELTGAALDWAVAKCEEVGDSWFFQFYEGDEEDGIPPEFHYSTDWALAGLIIEQECIAISCLGVTGYTPDTWHAQHPKRAFARGKTPLIAAMRCYVASKLGDEVQLPEGVQ